MIETRTWKQNATEYAALSVQGKDFRLALLAASSCVVGDSRSPLKIPIPVFASVAKTTPERVFRHLQAWDALAKKKMVPPFSSLQPQTALTFVPTEEVLAEFARVYDASNSGGRPRASIAEIVTRANRDSAYLNTLLNQLEPSARTIARLNLQLDSYEEVDKPRGPIQKKEETPHPDKVLLWANEAARYLRAVLEATREEGWEEVDFESLLHALDSIERSSQAIRGCLILGALEPETT
jgi:hypothetical protein